MAGIDEGLEKLGVAWEGIPAEVRAPAAEHLTAAAALLAEGLKVLGRHFEALQGPAVFVVLQAIQELTLWRKPMEEVAAKVERKFPSMVAILKALAPEQPPSPPPNAPPS